MNTANLNRYISNELIKYLIKNKVFNYYISPGMRNAPLIWAANNNKSDINIYSGIDERNHGFKALGHSKASNQYSCLICTSGSALTNYFPAITEAYKTETPLIIISADRPAELVKGNANQTINQLNLYGPYAQSISIDISKNINEDELSLIIDTLQKQLDRKQIIHINIAMNEPLDSTVTEYNTLQTDLFNKLSSSIDLSQYCATDDIKVIIEKIKKSKRPLLVIGQDNNEQINKKLIESINTLWNGHVYGDITSNIKFSLKSKNLIPSFDHPEVYEHFNKNKFDLIIHLNGRLTSKHYYRYLEENKDIFSIAINNYKAIQDPTLTNDLEIKKEVTLFNEILLSVSKLDFTTNIDLNFIKKKEELIESAPLTYPLISKRVLELIPSGMDLFIGNSTFIRSFDLYAGNINSKELSIYSNRGTSGIEGNLATTIGISNHLKKPVVLLIGDISLLHDFNTLFEINNYQSSILIICANNNSGGIFDLLPISNDKEIIDYLTTPHEVNFSKFTSQLGINTKTVSDIKNLEVEILSWCKKPITTFLEVNFNSSTNKELYDELKTIKL